MKRGALVQLKCAIQHYDWGVSGQTPSAVAELGSLNREEKIDEEKPHAELWMGTHLSGLNVIKETDSSDSSSSSLKQHVEANAKETLGEKCLKRFGNDLPFLLKVLSVAKALSIQAHPDKQLAEKLHEEKPHMYKDANHKPEMALAVTEFEAMSGFISEPKEALEKCPELKLLTGIRLEEMDAMKEDKKAQMKYLFTKVMLAEKEEVAKHVRALVKRLKEDRRKRRKRRRRERPVGVEIERTISRRRRRHVRVLVELHQVATRRGGIHGGERTARVLGRRMRGSHGDER